MTEGVKAKRKYTRKGADPAPESVESRVSAIEIHDTPPAPAGPPPMPMLTQDELHKLVLFQAQISHAKAEAETCRRRRKWILSLLDPKGTVETEEARRDKWLTETANIGKKYEAMLARASMRLNLDLSKCSFDTETGLVIPPDSAKGRK